MSTFSGVLLPAARRRSDGCPTPGSTAFCASERRTGPKNATLRPHAAPRLLHISRPLTKAHKNVRRSKTRFLSVGHLCRLHNASTGKTHAPRHCEATDSEDAGARLMKKTPGKKPGHVFSPKNALRFSGGAGRKKGRSARQAKSRAKRTVHGLPCSPSGQAYSPLPGPDFSASLSTGRQATPQESSLQEHPFRRRDF